MTLLLGLVLLAACRPAHGQSYRNGLRLVQSDAPSAPPPDPFLPSAPLPAPLAPQAEPLPPGTMAPQIDAPAPEDAVSLAQLEQLALQNNPTLARARAHVAAAQGQWLQAGLPPNPIAGYLASDIGEGGSGGKHGGFIEQRFITANKLQLARTVAEREIERAQNEAAAQQLRVLTDVRTSFYGVLLIQKRLELSAQLAGISRQAAKTVETLLQAREARRIDYLQARIEVEKAGILVEQTRNDHRAVWRQLSAVVGMPELAPQRLQGNIDAGWPSLTWDESLARLLGHSPQIAAASTNVQRACWGLRQAEAEAVPNVDAQVSVQHDEATGDTVTGVQAGFPLPLWNRNQGDIERARAEHAAAQQNLMRLELRLREQLAETFRRYADARVEASKYASEILPVASETLQLVSRGYEAGELPYLDLLTAQQTYFRANLDYVAALERLWSSAQQIDGLMLHQSLQP